MMRKAGWYWVRSQRFGGNWEVAELDGDNLWHFCGCGEPHRILFVTEIGPRIPTPDEPWQCVPVEPTPDMIEAGAQALVQWACDGLVWPDSWSALDVQSARKDAEKAYRAMMWHWQQAEGHQ